MDVMLFVVTAMWYWFNDFGFVYMLRVKVNLSMLEMTRLIHVVLVLVYWVLFYVWGLQPITVESEYGLLWYSLLLLHSYLL